ncbi:MAG: tetratricopeptide repeat protein [Gammaproteobacteria bacterium]|nr:tetratricopeptide repeat protein [Gammaproteobacteria bacterium]
MDGDQIYSLVMAINQGLTTDTSGYSNLILNNVPAINRDTTPAPAISVSPITGLVTSEAGGITSFSVVLEAPPSDKVVIDVVSNTSEGIVANNNSSALYSGNLSIYFDTTNWSDPQTISVKGVDDHVADGDTTYNIILDINLILTQDATGYSLLNPDDVSVTNLALVCEGVATGGKVVNGVTKFSGQACKGTSFYEVTGLTASTIYNVGLFGLTANADLSVYSSSDYSAAAACSPLLAGILDEHCQVSSDSLGKLWISVDANSSIGGTIFQLIVVDTPALLEGSVDVPLSLSYVNNLPYSGRVDTTISYYQLTGLAADTAYDVYLSQLTGDAQLSVYANTLLECQSTNAGLADEACMAFSDSSGNLVIQVDGTASFAGATYTIGVNAYSGSPAEGTATARLPLAYNGAVLPHSGSVSSRASYYQVNGLVANVDYVVSLTGLTANVDLSVSDPGTNSVVCGSANAGIIDEWCATTANVSGTLWIQVNPINASTGANYVLNVSAAPLPQGTLAQPLPVTSALSAPYAGSVGVVDSSYYSITGLTPGAAYEVSLTGLSGNADLYLYLTAKMNVIGCQSNNVGTASEICTLIADVSGNLWIKVDGSASAGGATFTLNVNLGPPTEIVLFNQGVALYDLADYVNATIKFDELLALYPAGQFAAEANLYIGKSKYRLLDYVAAINKFEFVFTNYANSLVIYDAHYWKGRALAKQNNLLLARTEYQFVIDNAGVSGVAGDASFQLAKTLYDAFNYTQAIVDFKAVLAKYSVFDKADNTQYYLAKSYHALANYTQARLEYNLLISNYVFSTWVDNAQYQIGRTYYDEATGTSSLTLFPTAIAEFQKVFAYPLATSADSAQYYIARSYHEMQNFTQARIEYDLVIVNYALGIWGDNAQYQIGKTYYDEAGINNNLALYDTAVIEFRKVFSFTLSSSSDSAQYYIARSFHAQQKYLEARVEYDLLLTTPAYSLSTLLDDGQYRKGKSYYDEAGVTANTLLYDSAVPELQKVLALYPSSTNAAAAQYYIGRSYHKIANISKLPLDYDAARTAYDKVSALNYPASSFLDDALYQRGATFYSEANFTTAILEFDKVVTLYITTNRADDALYYRGRSHQKKSMPDLLLARSDFASLISLFPSSIRADNAQYYTGLSYHAEGDCVAESAAMTLLLQDKYKGSIYVSKAQAHIDGIIAGTHTCI